METSRIVIKDEINDFDEIDTEKRWEEYYLNDSEEDGNIDGSSNNNLLVPAHNYEDYRKALEMQIQQNKEKIFKVKRKRNMNFTSQECELLVNIISQSRIIDRHNKQNESFTFNERKEEWNRIETIFNTHTKCVQRSSASLKEKYKIMKRNLLIKMKNSMQSDERGEVVLGGLDFTSYERMLLPIILEKSGMGKEPLGSETLPIDTSSDNSFLYLNEGENNSEHVADLKIDYSQPPERSTPPSIDKSVVALRNKRRFYQRRRRIVRQTRRKQRWMNMYRSVLVLSAKLRNGPNAHAKPPEKDKQTELLQLHIENLRKENVRREEEHGFKMEQLRNEERRREEKHLLEMTLMRK